MPKENWYETSLEVLEDFKIKINITPNEYIDEELFPTIEHTHGIEQIQVTPKWDYRLKKESSGETCVKNSYEEGYTYILSYFLTIEDGELNSIGCHKGSLDNLSIKVTNN
jgi:hypothetical protein